MAIELITEACGCCGCQLSPHGAFQSSFDHGEQVTCGQCGAINTMVVENDGTAYVGTWACEHGKGCDEPCEECENA